jgi:hypothetical protein
VRTIELPYFARNIEDIPSSLTIAMGNVFEAFSLMGRVWDGFATREGKITFPKIQSNDLSKVIVERDHWKGQVARLNGDLGLLKGENKQIKEQIQKIKNESVKSLEEALQWATTAEARAAEVDASLAKIRGKVAQTESDLATEREASERMKVQLSKTSSSSVKKFLGSNSFKYAAQFPVRNLMKYTIYRELSKLTKLYPLCPEQIGFASVDRESAIPSDMSSFNWDEGMNELFDMKGKPIEKKSKIHNHNPTGIVQHWDPTRWPKDLYILEDEEDEAAIPSIGDANAPDNTEV